MKIVLKFFAQLCIGICAVLTVFSFVTAVAGLTIGLFISYSIGEPELLYGIPIGLWAGLVGELLMRSLYWMINTWTWR